MTLENIIEKAKQVQSKNTDMRIYVRFTENGWADKKRGTSILDLPTKPKQVLPGLCAFGIGDFTDSTSYIINQIENLIKNYTEYSKVGNLCIYVAEYVQNNPNGVGVIINPVHHIDEYQF